MRFVKSFLNAAGTPSSSPSDAAATRLEQNPRLRFLPGLSGGKADIEARNSLTPDDITDMVALHSATLDSTQLSSALIGRARTLALDTRAMLEMINAVHQIKISEAHSNGILTSDPHDAAYDRWSRAYLGGTEHRSEVVERFIAALNERSGDSGESIKDYVETLESMTKGKTISWRTWRRFGAENETTRMRYLKQAGRGQTAPPPDLIITEKRTPEVYAHLEGLRQTYVSILTCLRRITEDQNVSREIASLANEVWLDMERTVDILNPYDVKDTEMRDAFKSMWLTEETRLLKVDSELLERKSAKGRSATGGYAAKAAPDSEEITHV